MSSLESSFLGKLALVATVLTLQPGCDHKKVGDQCSAIREELQDCLVENRIEGRVIDPEFSRSSSVEANQNPRQLTPEQSAATLKLLEYNFKDKRGQALHEGVEWASVKASLEARPEAIWSINEMEKAGHRPNVYNSDEKGFDIGTCSKESPASGRNCVYDEEAEAWTKTNSSDDKFNGSAMAMAKAMGVDLMDPTLYQNVLQKKGLFDEQSWSYLKTRSDIRSTGNALGGYRVYDGVRVSRSGAHDHLATGSWRGSLRVNWANF